MAMFDDQAPQGGLLGFMSTPAGQGLLSAVATGLATARRGRPLNNIGAGLLGGVQGYANAQDQQQQQQRAQQQNKLFDLTMQQHQFSLSQAQKAAEKEQMRSNYLGSLGKVTSPVAGAQPNQYSPFQALNFGFSPTEAQTLAGAKDWGAPEVARTIEVDDGKGGKQTLQLDKFGRPIGQGLPAYIAPVQVDTGGKVQFVKPTAGVSLGKTMTPGESASNSVAWYNAKTTRDRLTLDQNKPEFKDGQWVTPPRDMKPGEARTVGGAADKPLNDSQAKALLFGSRMQSSNDALNAFAAGDNGVQRRGNIKAIAETVPLLGDTLGTLTNWTQSDKQQQVEQAQRDFLNAVLRRESGAVISPTEFDSAAKQYFPQIGDSDAVLAQKAANRKGAIQGILSEVPANKQPQAQQPLQGGLSPQEAAELAQLKARFGKK